MIGWIPTVWLAFVAVRYGLTVLKAVREPITEGWDLTWTVSWLGFALVLTVSSVLFKRSFVNRIFAALIMAGVLAVLMLSRTLQSAAIAIAVLAICAGLGEFILQRLANVSTAGLLERLVITVPFGMGCLALAQLLLALLNLFNSATSWVLLLAMVLPAFVGGRSLVGIRAETGLEKHALLIMPIGYLFLLNLTWATAPEIQFDPLNVHLAVPRLYLQHGGLIDLPYFFHSYFAHLFDMFFGLCLALGGALVVKFVLAGVGLLAALAVFVIGRKLFNDEVGIWGALIFYSTPLVIWLSSTAYLDLPLTLFILASVAAFMRWHETSHWSWLAISGWIAGAAVGIKVGAIPALIVMPFFVIWHSWHKNGSLLRLIAAYCIPMLILAVPSYLLVYLHTGNPFFPFLNAVFRSPQWPLENTSLNFQDFGIGKSAGALIRLPFRLTFNSSLFAEVLPRGGMGVAALLAIPAIIFVIRGTVLQRLVFAVLALQVTIWALTIQYGRYFVPAIPFAAILGCAVVLEHSKQARWNRVLLFCCVLAQVPVASVLFTNVVERYPVNRALGRETEEQFLGRNLPGYNAAQFLNTVVKADENILGVGVENLRFYLNAPLYSKTEIDFDRPPYEFGKLGSGSELAVGLVRHRFVYVLVTQTDLEHHATFYSYLNPEFLNRFAVRIYSDPTAAVFRINNP